MLGRKFLSQCYVEGWLELSQWFAHSGLCSVAPSSAMAVPGAAGGGSWPGISSVGGTQVTLQRPPAAVYPVAPQLPPLSVACLGLVRFVSCCHCRRRSRVSSTEAAPYPKTPAAPTDPRAGLCWRSLLSPHLHTRPPAVSSEAGAVQGCGEPVLVARDEIRASQLDGGAATGLASLPPCSLPWNPNGAVVLSRLSGSRIQSKL